MSRFPESLALILKVKSSDLQFRGLNDIFLGKVGKHEKLGEIEHIRQLRKSKRIEYWGVGTFGVII